MATKEIEKKPEINPLQQLYTLITAKAGRLAELLPREIDAGRMLQCVMTSAMAEKESKIVTCTPNSILLSLYRAAQWGLYPDSVMGYLVPYWNKELGKHELQFQPSYRGLVHSVRRSGELGTIVARAVLAGDEFEYEYGLTERCFHRPQMEDPEKPRALTYAYSVARFRDREVDPQFDVMSRAAIDKIRAKSQQGGNAFGPWANHFDEMAKKTVVKRQCKMLPISYDDRMRIDEDEEIEAGISVRAPMIKGQELRFYDDEKPIPALTRAANERKAMNAASKPVTFEDHQASDKATAQVEQSGAQIVDTAAALKKEPAAKREKSSGPNLDQLHALAIMGNADARDELLSMNINDAKPPMEINLDNLEPKIRDAWVAHLATPKKGA